MTTTLADLDILALDCQATGANPKNGHLLEIGWQKTRAYSNQDSADKPVQSYLIELPPQSDIPRAVQRITGISVDDLTEAISALGTWLSEGFGNSSDGAQRIGSVIMGLPEEYAPETDCLQQGFEIFRQKYRDRIETQSPLRALTAMGAQLWRERLETQAQAQLSNEEDDAADAESEKEHQPEPFVWSPQAVVRAIESVFRRSAHFIRRARWFCMLSETSLGWESEQSADVHLNMLIFSNGNIIQREKLISTSVLPTPPGHAKPFGRRQKSFDVTTYDRLRIVTTELRRLIAEKRPLRIRLGPKTVLSRPQLEKVLRWV